MRLIFKKRTFPAQGAGGGKLNLQLTGFSLQDIVSVDDIVRAIDPIPSFHLDSRSFAEMRDHSRGPSSSGV
jgi:hypothetical protein